MIPKNVVKINDIVLPVEFIDGYCSVHGMVSIFPYDIGKPCPICREINRYSEPPRPETWDWNTMWTFRQLKRNKCMTKIQ